MGLLRARGMRTRLCWLIVLFIVLNYLPCRNRRGLGGSPRLLASAFVPSWQPTSTLWKIRQAAVPAGTVKTSKVYGFYAQNALQMSRKSADLVDDVDKTMEPSDEPCVLQPATKDTSTTLFHTLAKTQRLDSTAVLRTFLAWVSLLCFTFNQPAHAALSSGGHAVYQEALLPPAPMPKSLQDASTIVVASLDIPLEGVVVYAVFVFVLFNLKSDGTWTGPTLDMPRWKDVRATLFPVGVSTLCLSVAVWNSSNGDSTKKINAISSMFRTSVGKPSFRLFSTTSPILSTRSTADTAAKDAPKSAARAALRLLDQKSQMYAAGLSCLYTRDERATSRQLNQWAVEVDQKGCDIAQRNTRNRTKSLFGTRPASGRSYTGSRDMVVRSPSSSNDVDTMTVVSLIWSVRRNLKSCKVQSIKDVEKILTDIVVDANDGDCVIRAVATTIKGVSRDDLLEDFPEMTIV